MTHPFEIGVSELGVEACDAIDEIFVRVLGQRAIAEYAYGEAVPWSPISETGWDMIGVPEEDGGAGVGLRDLIAVGKVVGRWAAPLPLTVTMVLKRNSVAARENDGPVTLAVQGVSGRTVVPFGALPDIAVLQDGRTADGHIERAAYELFDDYSPTLRLAIVETPTPLAPETARELAIVWAAEAAGAGARAVDLAIEYAKQRVQFGQPIGRFQAIKHHLADALTQVERAESAALLAAADPSRTRGALELSFDSALRAAEIAVQVHGGIGFTWELGLHVYLRHIIGLRQLALSVVPSMDGQHVSKPNELLRSDP